MKLLIAIPALNEEQSIEVIIRRALEAKTHIVQTSSVKHVDITVVSDGSTDKTAEIASRYLGQIDLIVFKKNRGYGAAIKEAWKQSDADLLGFLDADGTCDPKFFSDLCRELERQAADIVLGCRINAQSKMPLIRRVGNVIYALLLTLFSSQKVRDTASGMRVVKRACLPQLMPLPNGMHFTPAMSARAILSEDIKIAELDMPYQERAGESKLDVIKDGLRFLRVITETAFLYRPERILWGAGFISFVFAAGLMSMPILFFLQNRRLEEWMIYRFVIGEIAGLAAGLFLCAGYLSAKMVQITIAKRFWFKRHRGINQLFSSRFFWFIPGVFAGIGAVIILPSFIYYLQTGTVHDHWSRFMVMSFFFSLALIFTIIKFIDIALDLIAVRLIYLRRQNDPWR